MIKDAVANHIPRDETVDGECVAPTGMNLALRFSELAKPKVILKRLLRIHGTVVAEE
jgi:hypothetical protein